MPSFGTASLRHLVGVEPRLVRVCERAIGWFDFTVLDGVRTLEEQAANVARGVSKTMESKHLPQADGHAWAVDLAPHPLAWADREMFCVLAGVMFVAAAVEGVTLRWGGDWDRDRSTLDERFRDYGHFELLP
jgi:peptidoglycan L-alanyl-D-glutamate endopeptidase CwlK